MKSLIYATVVVSALGFTACSSSKKSNKDAAKEAVKTAENKTDKAVKGAKETAKNAKAKAEAAVTGDVTCTSGKDSRSIGVKAVDAGCEVVYTKFGESSSVASASNGTEHCASVVGKIKDNLANAGFKCE